jgi:hypothetical protein
MIDNGPPEYGLDCALIETPTPIDMAGTVVFSWPFFCEQCFRFGVTKLLPEVSFDWIAAVMPNDSCRSVPESPTPLLQAPTHVDVIARDPKSRIETSDIHQRVAAICHVAARNMFSDVIWQ